MGKKRGAKRKQTEKVKPNAVINSVYKPVPFEHAVLQVFKLTYIPEKFLHYYFEDIDTNLPDQNDSWNQEQQRLQDFRVPVAS